MKSITLIFLLAGLSLSGSLLAQPGYQGKHFFVEGGIAGSLAIGGPTYNNRGLNEVFIYNRTGDKFALNTNYGFRLNYTFSRINNFYASLNFLRTGAIFNTTTPNLVLPQRQNEHYIFYQNNVQVFDVGVDNYFSYEAGNLAPLGWHYSTGLTLIAGKSQRIDHNVTYPNEFSQYNSVLYDLLTDLPDNNTNFQYLAVHFGMGRRMILFDRLTLNMGFKTYFIPAWYFVQRAENNYSSSDVSTNQEDYNSTMVKRLQKNLAINVHIGLGVLLF